MDITSAALAFGWICAASLVSRPCSVSWAAANRSEAYRSLSACACAGGSVAWVRACVRPGAAGGGIRAWAADLHLALPSREAVRRVRRDAVLEDVLNPFEEGVAQRLCRREPQLGLVAQQPVGSNGTSDR